MVLRLGHRAFGVEQLLVMAVLTPGAGGDPAAAMERVHAVVAEGADIVEVSDIVQGSAGGGDEQEEVRRVVPFLATVRDAYPELVIGVRTGRPEVAREACAAGADLVDGSLAGGSLEGGSLVGGSGGWLAEMAASSGVGAVLSLAQAERAVQMGASAERILVGGGLPSVPELVAAGWPVMVSPTDGDLAAAAVAAWLGARVFRVDRVVAVRRVLRMVSAIRGDSPPGHAVRGLALSGLALSSATAAF